MKKQSPFILFLDAVISAIWCFIWVIPAFILYFAASLFLNSLNNNHANKLQGDQLEQGSGPM